MFFLSGKTTTLLLFASESYISASSAEAFHPKHLVASKKNTFGCQFFFGGERQHGLRKPKEIPTPIVTLWGHPKQSGPILLRVVFPRHFSKQKKHSVDQSTEGSVGKKDVLFFFGGGEKRGRFANQGPLVLLPWPCWPWQGPWIVLPRSESFFFQKIWGIV